MTLTGADAELVRAALERGDPFPGTTGFAGELDGTLVRDVLGRVPLFFEADRPREWRHDLADLDDPRRLPPGRLLRGCRLRAPRGPARRTALHRRVPGQPRRRRGTVGGRVAGPRTHGRHARPRPARRGDRTRRPRDRPDQRDGRRHRPAAFRARGSRPGGRLRPARARTGGRRAVRRLRQGRPRSR